MTSKRKLSADTPDTPVGSALRHKSHADPASPPVPVSASPSSYSSPSTFFLTSASSSAHSSSSSASSFSSPHSSSSSSSHSSAPCLLSSSSSSSSSVPVPTARSHHDPSHTVSYAQRLRDADPVHDALTKETVFRTAPQGIQDLVLSYLPHVLVGGSYLCTNERGDMMIPVDVRAGTFEMDPESEKGVEGLTRSIPIRGLPGLPSRLATFAVPLPTDTIYIPRISASRHMTWVHRNALTFDPTGPSLSHYQMEQDPLRAELVMMVMMVASNFHREFKIHVWSPSTSTCRRIPTPRVFVQDTTIYIRFAKLMTSSHGGICSRLVVVTVSMDQSKTDVGPRHIRRHVHMLKPKSVEDPVSNGDSGAGSWSTMELPSVLLHNRTRVPHYPDHVQIFTAGTDTCHVLCPEIGRVCLFLCNFRTHTWITNGYLPAGYYCMGNIIELPQHMSPDITGPVFYMCVGKHGDESGHYTAIMWPSNKTVFYRADRLFPGDPRLPMTRHDNRLVQRLESGEAVVLDTDGLAPSVGVNVMGQPHISWTRPAIPPSPPLDDQPMLVRHV
jgi:hypothetical protein